MVRQVRGLATAVRYAALLALLVWSSVAARMLFPGMAAAAPWQEGATPAADTAPDSAQASAQALKRGPERLP